MGKASPLEAAANEHCTKFIEEMANSPHGSVVALPLASRSAFLDGAAWQRSENVALIRKRIHEDAAISGHLATEYHAWRIADEIEREATRESVAIDEVKK